MRRSSQAKRQPERREREPAASLARAPVLAGVCTAAALADLFFNRGLLRALHGSLTHATRVDLARWGALPRNLAAIAGVICFTVALYALLRLHRSTLAHRVFVSIFAAIFVPTVVAATVYPSPKFNPSIVLLGTATAHVLAVLLGLGALRTASRIGLRIGVGLVTGAAFLALGAFLVAKLGSQLSGATLSSFGHTIRRIGEVGFLTFPLAVGGSVVFRSLGRRGAIGRATGLVVATAVAGAVFYGRATLRPDFGIVLYGAQGVTLWLDAAPSLYAVPLAAGLGVGATAMLSSFPVDRQAGMGVCLLLAAGYAPQSAAELLMMVVGMMLLVRATIAAGQELQEQPQQSLQQLDRELGGPEDG